MVKQAAPAGLFLAMLRLVPDMLVGRDRKIEG